MTARPQRPWRRLIPGLLALMLAAVAPGAVRGAGDFDSAAASVGYLAAPLVAPASGVVNGTDGLLHVAAAREGWAVFAVSVGAGDLSATRFSVALSGDLDSWDLPPGLLNAPGASLALHWHAGAGPITVEVAAVTDTASGPVTTVELLPDAAAPRATVAVARQARGIRVSWTEADAGSGVVGRSLQIATGQPAAGRCTHLVTTTRVAIVPASGTSPSPTAAATIDRPSATLGTPAATPSPTGPALAATIVPRSGAALGGPGGLTGSVVVAAPPARRCLVATIVLTDSVGNVARVSSPPLFPAPPPWRGVELFRPSAYVAQATWRWCVGASAQIMINLVRHTADGTRATQTWLMKVAHAHDRPRNGKYQGTDGAGWVAALAAGGAGRYETVQVASGAAALNLIASRIRRTGRPAGILVMNGRHAWVVTGFRSTRDPAKTSAFRVTSVSVVGPLWGRERPAKYDLAPGTRLSPERLLADYFHPTSWTHRYTVIVPVP